MNVEAGDGTEASISRNWDAPQSHLNSRSNYTSFMTQPLSRPFLTEIRYSVQTYDIDFAGIVSNIVYIRWLEDLRLKLLEDHWPLEHQLRDGYTPVLISTEIEYLKALRLFERPVGSMWLSELGKARFTLEAEFVLGESRASRATQRCAFVDSVTFRPLRVPQGLKAVYEKAVMQAQHEVHCHRLDKA